MHDSEVPGNTTFTLYTAEESLISFFFFKELSFH